MGWTDERVEQLKQLWAEGFSAAQIARVLGGVTRNAVLGKVDRLNLAGKPQGIRSNVHGGTRHVAVKKAVSVPLPDPEVIVEDPMVFDDGTFVTLMTISDRMCHWPLGDPCDASFHYCGRKPKLGSPYCEGHARKAYVPQMRRRGARPLSPASR